MLRRSFLIVLLFVVGCAQTPIKQASPVSKTQYPLRIIDASNQTIEFTKRPARIISLIPSVTEVLFAIGAGDLVVAVDDWSDEPAAARALPKIGAMDVNIERIIALKPDVVFGIWTMNRPSIEALRAAGVTVHASEPRSINDTIAHIRTLGSILDVTTQTNTVIARMEEERTTVKNILNNVPEKLRVYVEFSEGWTVGPGEFMDTLIAEAGAINVATQPGWHQMNEETILKANPDAIVYSTGFTALRDAIVHRKSWKNMTAIKNNRLIGIDDNILSRPGPRMTTGLLQLTRALYPDRL
jgi:iron complex transport system substrate-binding protein